MTENSGVQESAPLERKDKNKKKRDDEQSKTKKRRRHFEKKLKEHQLRKGHRHRKSNPNSTNTIQTESKALPVCHRQNSRDVPPAGRGKLVLDFGRYNCAVSRGERDQRRLLPSTTRQRKQHAYASDHNRHRRSSLVKAQQRIRDESNKAENSMCWAILQRDGEKAVVVMLLGIVAGMCWMDAMNLRSGSGYSPRREFDSFVCTYSAGSNRSRQTLFILFKYPSQLSIMNYRCFTTNSR
ncbi:hypothetical protein GQ600_13876 [Phytophthora cactorum]|nr:hypothetical protein GQ600_13876 [Phytophthora cactorum]